jgi:predicted  nucleic acid-binding Zn-ribbon protein
MGRARKTITQDEYNDLERRLQKAVADLRTLYVDVSNRLPRIDTRLAEQIHQAVGKINKTRNALPEYVRPEDH